MPKQWNERGNDPEFMDFPNAALAAFEALTPDSMQKLQSALVEGKEEEAEQILGLQKGELQTLFQTLMGKVGNLVGDYPELLDPNKGISE